MGSLGSSTEVESRARHDGDADTYLEHKHDQITVQEQETAAVAELTQHWTSARRQHGLSAAVMIAATTTRAS